MNERTALYRIFGEGDLLLYVGISGSPERRWVRHSETQPWWPEVRSMKFAWHESREDALIAEKQAIREEKPRYNVQLRSASDATRLARLEYDAAYQDLLTAIRSDLEAGSTVTDVADAAEWSREYIGQIRAGTAGDAPRKRRTTNRPRYPSAG